MIHRGRTSERREKIPTPHKPRLSSCTSNAFTAICFSSPDMSILVVQVSALCFARRHSWILLVQCCRLGVLRRQYSERKVVVHASHSVLLRQQKTYTCHMYLSKSASADVDLRRGVGWPLSPFLRSSRRGGTNSSPATSVPLSTCRSSTCGRSSVVAARAQEWPNGKKGLPRDEKSLCSSTCTLC